LTCQECFSRKELGGGVACHSLAPTETERKNGVGVGFREEPYFTENPKTPRFVFKNSIC